MLSYAVDDGLTLEVMVPAHADELFRLTDANRAHLRNWLPWLDDIQSVEDTKRFIELTRMQLAENNGFQTVLRAEGALTGVLGHHGIDWMRRTTSLGYWLSAAAEGRGLMTRSCRVLVDHAFREFALERVEIRCAVENVKSRAIPERLGFRFERTLQKAEWLYDHFVDHVVYAMHKRDWAGTDAA